MAVSKQKKEEVLQELRVKFQNAKSISFAQYEGMSVANLSELRSQMRKAGAEFKVAKRTLLKIVAKEMGVELPDDVMPGTVGAVFSYEDAVSGPKIVKDASKKMDKLQLFGGMMEGRLLLVRDMKELADLPSKEVLYARFAGMMRAPMTSFHGMMNNGLGSFARALEAYAEKQSS